MRARHALPPAPTPARPLTLPFTFLFGAFTLPDAPVAMEHGRVEPERQLPGGDADRPLLRRHLARARRKEAQEGEGPQLPPHQALQEDRRPGLRVKAGKKAKVRVRISSVGRRAVNRAGTLKVHVYLRRTKRSKKATKIGTLKVHASRRTKRRHPAKA